MQLLYVIHRAKVIFAFLAFIELKNERLLQILLFIYKAWRLYGIMNTKAMKTKGFPIYMKTKTNHGKSSPKSKSKHGT
jgi:hypothetical protein